MKPMRATIRSVLTAIALCLALATPLHTSAAQETVPDGPTTAPTSAAETHDLAGLVSRLPKASYNEKSELAGAIAETGNPRVELILSSFSAGRLQATKEGRVVIALKDDGPYEDALTGDKLGMMEGIRLKKVRVNNRLRGELHGLVARLALSSPDASIRRHAARETFDAADPDSLPSIEKALSRETESDIAETLRQARAAIILKNGVVDEEGQLAAIETLRDRGDLEALNALLGLDKSDNLVLRESAASAVRSIKRTLEYWDVAQNVYYGLSLGSVLLLAAIGLAITFGVMGVINMAHGEMIMLGAYTTYVVQQVLLAVAPSLMSVSLIISIPAAFIVAGGAGILIERTIIRFLYGRPLETLLATWGLSLILQQAVRTIFGPTNKPVVAPDWMSGAFQLGQLTITSSRIWIIVFSMIVLAVLMAFLKYTHFGTQTRAVTQNRKMAASMGVRTNLVDALTFGLGSGVAGIAGVALSQIDNVSPNLGQSYIIDSFMVVVFGGVGNLWGTLVGAMTLGVANKLLEPFAGAVVGKIVVLIFIILFIQRRPRGLFALKGRFVDA
ncbi:urea transport system permease protein [Parvibaculum indicum]|uniref:urea ABC transporter permease subunit UrtB n=1 Tax=Parvibaculum indicum TaxID=562969 RepID=UPI0031B5AF10|nr:urea transport system permease protein [Parvibaculum indicum]